LLIDGFELFKITVFCIRGDGISEVLYNLPLFLCSIQLITIPLAAFSKGRVKEASLDFVCIFGLLGAILGTYAAGNNYAAYPVLSLDNVVSGITHCISGFVALYIFISGMTGMKKDNMVITFGILLVFCMIFSMMPMSASAAADSSTLMQISSATQEKLGLSDSDVQRYEGYYAIRNAADLFAYGDLDDLLGGFECGPEVSLYGHIHVEHPERYLLAIQCQAHGFQSDVLQQVLQICFHHVLQDLQGYGDDLVHHGHHLVDPVAQFQHDVATDVLQVLDGTEYPHEVIEDRLDLLEDQSPCIGDEGIALLVVYACESPSAYARDLEMDIDVG
jgi:hypothetical membrane protein